MGKPCTAYLNHQCLYVTFRPATSCCTPPASPYNPPKPLHNGQPQSAHPNRTTSNTHKPSHVRRPITTATATTTPNPIPNTPPPPPPNLPRPPPPHPPPNPTLPLPNPRTPNSRTPTPPLNNSPSRLSHTHHSHHKTICLEKTIK